MSKYNALSNRQFYDKTRTAVCKLPIYAQIGALIDIATCIRKGVTEELTDSEVLSNIICKLVKLGIEPTADLTNMLNVVHGGESG